ncbi:MAG: phage tail protein [Isosphaeraceae bacterium]
MARVDPYHSMRFRVELDGIIQAGFTECSGVGSSVEVVEYREGGDASHVRKLPGKTSYPDITLKWGITDSHELYDWHATALAGNPMRKNGSIVLYDHNNTERVRWNFFGAWASKYDGPSFNATGNEVAIDSLTITCERLERASQ